MGAEGSLELLEVNDTPVGGEEDAEKEEMPDDKNPMPEPPSLEDVPPDLY